MLAIKIEELEIILLENFSNYLGKQMLENGNGDHLIQPLSRKQSILDKGLLDKFRNGIRMNFGETGWRKVWITKNKEGEIIGHIDIRSHKDLNTQHRVSLGMGVDAAYRKLKIGERMLDFVIKYCKNEPRIAWLDLEVLTNNTPAIKLYDKKAFQKHCTIEDMFRIEGHSYSYTSMTLKVEVNN